MSLDTHTPSSFRSKAFPTSTHSAKRQAAPDLPPIEHLTNDTAILIGLALSYSRHNGTLGNAIPDVILSRLRAHADRGEPACGMLIDWFDLWSGKPADDSKTAIIGAETGGVPMDRIVRFFVLRLRQVARREAMRNAAVNGLLGSGAPPTSSSDVVQ